MDSTESEIAAGGQEGRATSTAAAGRQPPVATRCEGLGSFSASGELVEDHLAGLRSRKLASITAGVDVIDLSMFNPDLAPPRFLLDKLMEASAKPFNHRYAISRGIRKLREAFSQKWKRRFGVSLDPEREVCATLGSKDALLQALLAVARPGQTALCISPVYPAYRAALSLARLNLVTVPLAVSEEETLGRITDAIVHQRPKILLLNFPHNPTGVSVSRKFWEGVLTAASAAGATVFNDFVYGELRHDGSAAISALSVEGAKNCCVESYSLSKAYSVPGWRVGALAGNSEIVAAVSHLKSNVDYGIFLPVQMAAAAALESTADLTRSAADEYRQRGAVLGAELRRLGFEVTEPSAGGSLWAKAPEALCSHAASGGISGSGIAEYILERTGVVAAPGGFYDASARNYLRFALVAPVEKLRELGARLARL